MQTVTERPFGCEEIPPPQGRRWYVGALVLLVVAAAGALVMRGDDDARARDYRPLTVSGMGTFPIWPGATEGDFGDEDRVLYPYSYGDEFQLGVHVYNSGDKTIEVIDLPPQLVISLAERVQVELGPAGEMGMPYYSEAQREAFAPFVLEPGASRSIWLSYRMTNCSLVTPGSLTGVTLEVRTRHRSFEQDVVLPLPDELWLQSPGTMGGPSGMAAGCPEVADPVRGVGESAGLPGTPQANLRFVLPSYRAWVTSMDERLLEKCVARVETEGGRVFRAPVGRLSPGESAQRDANAFTDAGGVWDPAAHPPLDLELSCVARG